MLVIDSTCNGFRHLVLPIALTDDLVLSAVLAASAFHLAGNKGYNAHPESLYAGAIHKLQQRRELTGCDFETRQRVILAIVVLLVVVMINGCSDFPVMFRMLQSALDAIGGEEELVHGGEVAEFSLRQIRKMRVYAAPLLSPDAGLHAMTAQSAASFDCLTYYMHRYPQHAEKFFILADLRRQAFSIYIDRVLGAPWVNEDRVDNFIETFGTFPRDAPGEHIVTWSSFIVASETRNPDSQEFFRAFLTRQFTRNGFGNIPRALDLLEAVWSAGGDVDWPALLPEPKVFIM
ncbi:uncharacterized protein J7T54_005139 [Emericellopsis cladophorae]|uniref:Uncharacterized protein n=1 Tax=Emericellopsis cladophorae TaxID=2686198 RepID=A0A9P9Y1P8_9HYPO|nr:uncharacterized protein J7T54_005139 [Emericellopsis cladophorae]KAI6781929.1 hypothetical protein J7T54_005139 [Emericellopsis cladophorae]